MRSKAEESPHSTPPTLLLGDCLPILRDMDDNSVDSVVTDPPYGLSFMSKTWDKAVPPVEIWCEVLRVLKPGGHLLAFAGTRTQHRMAVRIEDAGFEIRDMIAWIYGSGFPKSLAVDKALDGVLGKQGKGFNAAGGKEKFDKQDLSKRSDYGYKYEPATEAARQWQGWGTALKPAMEPITVARKPLDGTVAGNVLAHGTGALNIDGCRVGTDVIEQHRKPQRTWREREGRSDIPASADYSVTTTSGRWPANLIHDGSDEVVAAFPDTGKSTGGRIGNAGGGNVQNIPTGTFTKGDPGYGDEGSAARFFYCAKASKRDRGEGNTHPTVKPVGLMRYLCRLVTPANGVVLDPFMGSGSTGVGALLEGFRFIGVELEEASFDIAVNRIMGVYSE